MQDDFLVRVAQIFHVAADLPPEDRAAYLDEHCGGDAALRAEVESLLPHLKDALFAPHLPDAQQIGPYRLLSVIGEGGFGLVYLARQDEPVRRVVALKVLKAGMDTRQVVARFEAERQAMAMMDHPGIAHVFDAGATESGRPYFVMEHVAGDRITGYADRRRFTTDERLTLFIELCDAVQHAHQRGIIHRDLKPSNVLVETVGDRAAPKVIDFGIAKALSAPLTERTLFTETGQMMGTPEYMSPEQAEMSGESVDTRSDIYSLGVILYELLSGTLPYDSEILRHATPAEIRQRLRDEQPQRPSTRISPRGEESTDAAARQRTEPRSLRRRLRGDLDWIIMKALEKERTRRYASASEFAADIRRHLDHEPVLAGPPGAGYRIGKFVRRNKAAVVATALVALALVAGIIGTTWGLLLARTERDDAVMARAEAERSRGEERVQREKAVATMREAERAREEERRQRRAAEEARGREAEQRRAAERAVDFLVKMLGQADPGVALRPDTRVHDLLESAGKAVERHFAGQPQAEAKVRWAIGHVHVGIGEYREGEPHLERALELLRRFPNRSTEGRLDYFRTLVDAHLVKDYLGDRDTAGRFSREAYQIGCGLIVAAVPAAKRTIESMKFAGNKFPTLLRELWQEVISALEPDHPVLEVGRSMMWLGIKHQAGLRMYPNCESTCRLLLELQQESLPRNHPRISRTIDMLGHNLLKQGKSAEALRCFQRSLALEQEVLPQEHWHLAFMECRLAGWFDVPDRRLAKAEAVLLAKYPVVRDALGANHTHCLEVVRLMAGLYDAWARPETAEEYHVLAAEAETIDWVRAEPFIAGKHPALAAALDRLDDAVVARGPVVREAMEAVFAVRRRTLPLSDTRHRRAAIYYGDLMHVWGSSSGARFSGQAEAMLAEALTVRTILLPEQHAKIGLTLLNLARRRESGGGFEEGEKNARRCAAIMTRIYGPDDWRVHAARGLLGSCLAGLRRYREAEPLLTGSYRALVEDLHRLGLEVDPARMFRRIRDLYEAWEERGDAPPEGHRTLAELRALRPSGMGYGENLHMGQILDARGEYAAAYDAFESALEVNPTVAQDQARAASVAAQRYDREHAIEHLEKAIALGPRLPWVHFRAARVHRRLGDLDEAIRWQRRALQLGRIQQHNFRLMATLQGQGATVNREIRRRFPLTAYHNNLGVWLKLTGRADEAFAAFESALAVDPWYPLARANIAHLRLLRGDLAAATTEAEKALAMNIDQPIGNRLALAVRGRALFLSGKVTEGADYLRRAAAMRLRPSAFSWRWLGDAFVAAGRAGEARRILERQVRDWPEEPYAWDALACLLVRPEGVDRSAGLEAAQHAVAFSNRRNPVMLATMAEALFVSGRAGEAAAVAVEALEVMDGRDAPGLFLAEMKASLGRYRQVPAASPSGSRR